VGAATDLIKGFEGCRLKAYQDVGGVWTCGWGSTGPDVGPNTVWTQAQADSRLEHVVTAVESVVKSLVHVTLSENQLAALVCFAYNVGTSALGGSTLLKKLNAGDPRGASDEFIKWDHVKGKVVPGLLNRRHAERALFCKDLA
jgi:lysozyme